MRALPKVRCTCPVFPLSRGDNHLPGCPILAVQAGESCGICGVTVWEEPRGWVDAGGSLGVRGIDGHPHSPAVQS